MPFFLIVVVGLSMSENAGIATTVGDAQKSSVLTGLRVWTRIHEMHLVTTRG